MSLPEPPPLPPLVSIPEDINLVTDEDRAAEPRYGVLLDPYVRQIISGPYFLVYITGGTDSKCYLSKSGSGDDSIIVPRRFVTEWVDNTSIGGYDQRYPPIPIDGKFKPGIHCIADMGYGYTLDVVINEGPYLGRDDDGRPAIFYVCKEEYREPTGIKKWLCISNRCVYKTMIIEETFLSEAPAHRNARMKHAANLTLQADIIQNLVTVAAKYMEKKGLPQDIGRHIGEFVHGDQKYVEIMRRTAASVGGNKPTTIARIHTIRGGRRTKRQRRLKKHHKRKTYRR